MRIAYITAGAAGMLCGSCLHDNTLAAVLKHKGHEVALIPTYTPVRTDEQDVSEDRVFFGAINVYLQQWSALFQHTPGIVHWLLDRPALLNWVSVLAGSTNARDLGGLTRSVLQGEEGPHKQELDSLLSWLRDDFRPDIVHITNTMLLGMAGPMKRELNVPVVCSVQGEDIFLEELTEPFKSEVDALLRRHAAGVDVLIATSDYYADYMGTYLQVPAAKMRVVRLGINLDGYPTEATGSATAGAQPEGEGARDRPFTIGYLARICPEKGLHNLAEATRILAARVGPERLRLRVAGYMARRDRPYLDGLAGRLERSGLGHLFDYAGEVDRAGKLSFLQSLDVLSVPTVYRESKGLYVLEALASGVPVVQPSHGNFPEMIEATAGGVLVEPENPEALADGLQTLLEDGARRAELGERGRAAVHARFSDGAMADATLEAYAEQLS